MSLYCLNCKEFIESTNKKCKCKTSDLISVTKNMLPVALIADSLGLQVASAFCLKNKYNQVEAGVYFKCTYPDVLLQDLPSSWYWTDYITIDNRAICSCLSYEADYVDSERLEEFIDGVINDLIEYLNTRDKNGLKAVLTLLEA